jgi:hypothetical protein
MKLDKILSIPGKPGLYEIVTQTRVGFVAKSILDEKKISVSFKNNISVLSEIAIYTLEEEVPLKEVFKSIFDKEAGQPTSVSHKASKDELEEYFFKVLPNFDEDRVYPSDIKKVIQWYNILLDKGLLVADQEIKEEAEAPSES